MKMKISHALFILILITSCKKDKHYQVTGRLLLSSSQPVPVTQYKLDIYQPGSFGAPIAIGTTSSQANGITDMNGRFTFRFTEGKGMFMGIPTSNASPAVLSGYENTGLPGMYLLNFPYKDAAQLGDIYLYKKVDAVYIVLNAVHDILPTDSFRVYGTDMNGNFRRTITGISALANSTVNLDTIIHASFPSFDFSSKKYINRIQVYNNKSFMNLRIANNQDSLSAGDDASLTLLYNVY